MNVSNPSMEKAPRHMGIELLRIVATGMIVLHHLLAHGGLLAVFPSPGPTDAAMRLLNAFAYCAVNLYGLISGYGSSGRFRVVAAGRALGAGMVYRRGADGAFVAADPGHGGGLAHGSFADWFAGILGT
ncbi:MAG: hypothetical protein ACLUE8_17565 [Lachnospiraceae bacterium]